MVAVPDQPTTSEFVKVDSDEDSDHAEDVENGSQAEVLCIYIYINIVTNRKPY